jgi:hypothetical protein
MNTLPSDNIYEMFEWWIRCVRKNKNRSIYLFLIVCEEDLDRTSYRRGIFLLNGGLDFYPYKCCSRDNLRHAKCSTVVQWTEELYCKPYVLRFVEWKPKDFIPLALIKMGSTYIFICKITLGKSLFLAWKRFVLITILTFELKRFYKTEKLYEKL